MRSNIDILKDRIDALEVIAFKIVRGRKEDELVFLKNEIASFSNLIGHVTGDGYDLDIIDEFKAEDNKTDTTYASTSSAEEIIKE